MKRRFLWCLLAAVAVITIAWPMIPLPQAKGRLALGFNGSRDFQILKLDLKPEDREFLGKADASQYLVSMKDGSRLVLTVIDGTENRHAVHDPAYCFSGGGWKIRAKNTIKLPSGEATLITLAMGSRTAEALWFFDDAKHQFASPLEYWFRTGFRRMTLGRSGAEPILVTLRSLEDGSVDWDRVRQIVLPSLGFN